MKNKKITIIGKGTAGAMSYNHFANYTDWDIECYYDSSIKEQSVGEGTTISLPRTLNQTIGFEFHELSKIDGNYKNGIKYIDWVDDDYMHTFPAPDISMHFNALKLQKYIQEKNKDRVKFIDKEVSNVFDIDTDYVIDCSGRPNKFDDFELAEFIPVNAAYIRQCYWDMPKYDYTLCIARPYGWIFGIPLANRMSFGYLYNTDINDEKTIKSDLLEVIKSFKLQPDVTENTMKFSNYYRKQNFFDNIAYNGNSSFFLEPMEATSLTTVDNINRKVYDILNYGFPMDDVNDWYKNTFKQLQDIIVMHYLGANKYETKFWKHANELAEKCLSNNNEIFKEILDNLSDYAYNLFDDYGVWRMHSFRQNIYSLGITKKLRKMNV